MLFAVIPFAVLAIDVQLFANLSESSLEPFDNGLVTRCVGSSHASTGLRADWQHTLRGVAHDLGTSCVRFHGLLDDDMSVVLHAGKGKVKYSFVNIFNVFDFLLSIGVRPLVELSFMPSLLASDPSATVFWYRGGISPPSNYSKWSDLIRALATALRERYGAEEVRTWRFEVWNEPNDGFWAGTQADYWDLYEEAARGLKAASDKLQVGGPATCCADCWIKEFVGWADAVELHVPIRGKYCKKHGRIVGARRNFLTQFARRHSRRHSRCTVADGLPPSSPQANSTTTATRWTSSRCSTPRATRGSPSMAYPAR